MKDKMLYTCSSWSIQKRMNMIKNLKDKHGENNIYVSGGKIYLSKEK